MLFREDCIGQGKHQPWATPGEPFMSMVGSNLHRHSVSDAEKWRMINHSNAVLSVNQYITAQKNVMREAGRMDINSNVSSRDECTAALLHWRIRASKITSRG